MDISQKNVFVALNKIINPYYFLSVTNRYDSESVLTYTQVGKLVVR